MFHFTLVQKALIAFCNQHDIQVVAYSNLGCGNLLKDPVILAAAEAGGVSASVALLRWGVQKGLVVLPKSKQPHRIAAAAPSVLLAESLSESTMAALDACTEEEKYCWDPGNVVL
jgi:methylglyoxal/glyoxal reductase